MADREKVIRGLKLCAYDPDPGQELKEIRSCPECPYCRAGCSPQLMRDALALLKEQEPRVMTLEEVEEMVAKSDPDPVCAEWSTGRTGWIVGSIHLVAAMMKNGNRDIRVWTSRPTPEQMRDTPWKGEEDHEA